MATTDSIVSLPSDLKPGDGRFGCGPSKVRPEALASLAEQSHLMGTSHRQAPVRDVVRRVREGLDELLQPPRRLRGRARQRRDDGVLGVGLRLAGARALAPPHLRRVLAEVRQGDRRGALPRRPDPDRGAARRRARPARRARRRPDRLGPQRDLDRRDGPGRAPRRRGRRADRDRRHLGRRRAAARRLPGRRLLLRPAEGLRLRRRALACGAQPRGDRPDRGARRRRGPLAARISLARGRARQLAQAADLQHARAGDPDLARRPDRVDERERRARLVRRRGPATRPRASTSGPRLPTSRPHSSPIRRNARWSSARSTSSTTSTRRRSPRRSAPTASSTPSPTASSAATSYGSGCSRRSSPTTSRR